MKTVEILLLIIMMCAGITLLVRKHIQGKLSFFSPDWSKERSILLDKVDKVLAFTIICSFLLFLLSILIKGL